MSNGLPAGLDALSRRIAADVESSGPQGRARVELVRRWARDGGPETVEHALAELRDQGVLVERQGRWRARSVSGLEVGVVEALEDGQALVRSSDRREETWRIPHQRLAGALDGDRVLVRPAGVAGAPGTTAQGVVERVLARRHETVVGLLEPDEEGRDWLLPFDPKLPLRIEVTARNGARPGEFVVVGIDRAVDAGLARGRVVETLGPLEAAGTDVLVMLRHYGIPEEHSPDTLAAVEGWPADPRPADAAGREDLRDEVLVTIDGASARDLDDAVSVERLPAGLFRVGVHIADVAHYVEEGSPLDLEAFQRGTSVYYPERAIPMLPESLSNGLCSLHPGVPRLALSVFLDFDLEGKVVSRRFAETVIETKRRLTYEEVRRVLEQPQAGDPVEYGPVLNTLLEARALMEILRRARMARGSLDFDLPEGDVVLDTDGEMVGVQPGQRHVAHRIVEELMIAANEAVAEELVSHQRPALYRVHHAPDPRRLDELRELLRPLGIAIKGRSSQELHPSALQTVLRRIEGQPEEPFVTALVLRAQQRAVYSPSCDGHYALASRYYTHFTSPIRRYPDLVVHRQLKELLGGRTQEAEGFLEERLPVIAKHASKTERRAERSERDLLQWKKVRFLAERQGERFPGRITGVQPFGVFVQLEGYFVDGLVPVASMGDDYYEYEAEGHQLVGSRTGRTFRLAQQVEVVLAGVEPRRRSLDLVIADMPTGAARRGGRTLQGGTQRTRKGRGKRGR